MTLKSGQFDMGRTATLPLLSCSVIYVRIPGEWILATAVMNSLPIRTEEQMVLPRMKSTLH